MYILQHWNDFRVNEKNLADIALKVWNHFLFYEGVMISVDILQIWTGDEVSLKNTW